MLDIAGFTQAAPERVNDVQTKPDRIFADAEDDRDRCGGSFGRLGTALKEGIAITATRRRTRSAMTAGRRS